MSVVRGRPPGLAGGIIGTRRAYCSSLRACAAPKSPTSARLSAVHMAYLQEGSLLPEPPTSLPCAPAYLSRPGFSNGLLLLLCHELVVVGGGPKARRQQGQRGRRRISATARCRRKVAIDPELCRSGRTGGAAGAVVGRPLGA